MPRRVVLGGIAIAVLVVIGAAAGLLLASHHAPGPLGLSSPAPASSQGGRTGTWKVAAGSEAGYRVKEKFVNQPATTEAVARTTVISGGLQVESNGASELKATNLHFSADLSALQSEDRYATFKAFQRDFFVGRIYLETGRYPNAIFKADTVILPAGITSGLTRLVVPGMLTVHGVTHPVTTQLEVQVNGSQIEVAGSMTVDMRDFNIEPPDISFTKAEPGVVIEYHLLLVPA